MSNKQKAIIVMITLILAALGVAFFQNLRDDS
jgi:hypothetical protein